MITLAFFFADVMALLAVVESRQDVSSSRPCHPHYDDAHDEDALDYVVPLPCPTSFLFFYFSYIIFTGVGLFLHFYINYS